MTRVVPVVLPYLLGVGLSERPDGNTFLTTLNEKNRLRGANASRRMMDPMQSEERLPPGR